VKGVVGDQAAPDEAPKCIDRFAGISTTNGLMQWVEEAGARRFECSKKLLSAFGERFNDWSLLREQWKLVGKEKSDATIAFSQWLDTSPCNFARSDERVKAGWIVVGDAGRQNGRFKQ